MPPALTLAQCVGALEQLCQYRAQGSLEGPVLEALFIVWRLRAEMCVAQCRAGGGGNPHSMTCEGSLGR